MSRLIELYILGVFLSFCLSQFGPVRHWTRQLRDPDAERGGVHASRVVNLVGGPGAPWCGSSSS